MCSLESFGCGEVNPLRLLGDNRPERAQCIEVEVDGAVADSTPAEVGNEGFTQLVQQRPTEQNRDSA